jgi:hypothetical protein
MLGAGGGSGYVQPTVGRGAALVEAHYALITPQQRVRAAEFLTLSLETAWQGFEDPEYQEGFWQQSIGYEGTRGSRLLVQPGVFWGLGNEVAAFHLGARAQLVNVLRCEKLADTTRDLCRSHEPTRATVFVNGVFQLGLELKLGPVVPYFITAIDTRGIPAMAGGLGVRFGHQVR